MPKDSNRIRGTTREIEEAARRLRQELTSAESILWQALRGRKLEGLKFRCQHPEGRFVVATEYGQVIGAAINLDSPFAVAIFFGF
ncbi:DUF559 domain-containing protein [Tumidithrix elongata RA019]|uniref:DUF559 domain-containing protein n=1 Tax=Tumidithrix elongata BACA0141 TaxID=2716417 RepID=A0AAW9PXQ6_9CYAN|nr:DUF559 domain-containing protein [Tumidithrix elongata RA019]